jgi:hypothetical protein
MKSAFISAENGARWGFAEGAVLIREAGPRGVGTRHARAVLGRGMPRGVGTRHARAVLGGRSARRTRAGLASRALGRAVG